MMRGKSVIHLATHGYFLSGACGAKLKAEGKPDALAAMRLPGAIEERITNAELGENPLLLSGLVLAGANNHDKKDDADDGYLTAEEVTALDLTGTRIVVLSACDAGLGKLERGEGIMGLRRAFLLAGAQNVVMSLWRVPDKQTRELMGYFYDDWIKTQNAGAAMQTASLKMLESRRKKGLSENPLYWASFICVGNPLRN